MGHQVITAASVTDAKSMLEESDECPDLFIVDVGLREFRGLEFIEFLKADARWEKIPILIQSMSRTMDFYQFCEGTLKKPYSAAELTRQVGLMLSGSNK
jgi:DNA-binding response OmpR family regulator